MKADNPGEPVAPGRPLDPEAFALAERLASDIVSGAASSPRSTQESIGSSEIGAVCDRQLAYRIAGTPATNLPDPLRALVGVGLHHVLADIFRRHSGRSGRYLVEYPVTYGGVPGTVDLYDRWSRTVIDWKSTTAKKLHQVRREGPRQSYVVQAQMYAAGLREAGEDPVSVALVYLPVDGTLQDIWAWLAPASVHTADMAVARLDRLRATPLAEVAAQPSRLCGWCANLRRGAPDVHEGCPGEAAPAKTTIPPVPTTEG